MKILKLNETGKEVYWLRALFVNLGSKNLPITENFDEQLEGVVVEFQEQHALYADGVVGNITFSALETVYRSKLLAQYGKTDGLVEVSKISVDKYLDGYSEFRLRSDVANALVPVREELHNAGALLTSAGGIRQLGTPANAAQSATSMHYVGRAIDLAVGSGMENPKKDPYVITSEGDRLHRVYARAKNGQEMELDAITYTKPITPIKVAGKFVDLTEIMRRNGFERIRARPGFYQSPPKGYLSAEWWHFQYMVGLIPGYSTFGEELSLIWSSDQLKNSPPWKYKDNIFGVNWG